MKHFREDEYPSPPRTIKKIRLRLRLSRMVAPKAADLPPPALKRKNTPHPIIIPCKSRSMAHTKAVHKPIKPSAGSYDESLFDLSSRRLINPLPVKYEWRAEQNTTVTTPGGTTTTVTTTNSPGGPTSPRFWFPAPVEDDIEKRLFLHPCRRGLVWVGRLAEAKLAEEVKKYNRVKDLWLFQASDAFLPGFDERAEFVACVYEHEMLSPWVVCWLGELIGEEAVGRILERVEANLEKSLAGM